MFTSRCAQNRKIDGDVNESKGGTFYRVNLHWCCSLMNQWCVLNCKSIEQRDELALWGLIEFRSSKGGGDGVVGLKRATARHLRSIALLLLSTLSLLPTLNWRTIVVVVVVIVESLQTTSPRVTHPRQLLLLPLLILSLPTLCLLVVVGHPSVCVLGLLSI